MAFLRICGSYHVRTSCGQFEVSAVKGEYRDLVMFNMQLGLGIARCSEEMSGMLSTCTYAQLINRGITDHFSRLGRASLIFNFTPFDPGSRLLTMFHGVTRNSVFCVASDDLPCSWNVQNGY